jgi:hypothetical protein
VKTLLRDVRREWRTLHPSARLAIWSVLLGPALVVLVFSMAVAPADFSKPGLAWFPRCPYKLATGLDCPTCGITRAFCAFSHGRFCDGEALNTSAIYPYLMCWAACIAYGSILATRLASLTRGRTAMP